MSNDLIGQSLGRYHILEQLGEGGMAIVYKAYDMRLERDVAIKIVLPMRQHSEKFLKRFEQEARALAKLSHPNIVGVIDYGEHEGLPYLVMEYLPGGTLKQKLKGKPIAWQEAIHILLPVARALAYAHQHGIIHRDVKPSNILITDSGEPMLSDFGVAKMLEAEETLDLTGTGVGVGTPEYMSPEQAQGKSVDGRSDLYSLGVVFYEIVTGRKPYQADTPLAVVWKQASESLPRPTDWVKQLPQSVEQVLLKALAKQPEDRYQSMTGFANSLENLTQAKSPVRRVSMLVIAAIAVIVFLAGFFLWQRGTNELLFSHAPAMSAAADMATVSTNGTSIETSTPLNFSAPLTAAPSSTPATILEVFQEFNHVLFHDDFESGLNIFWGNVSNNWKVVNDEGGNHVLLAEKVNNESWNDATFGSSNWGNYKFNLRFKFPDPGYPSLYIHVRHSSSGSYAVDCHSGYGIYLNKASSSSGQEFTLSSVPLSFVPNQWYSLSVLVDGSTIYVTINGQVVMTYTDTDSPVLSGNVAIVAFDNTTINLSTGIGGATRVLLDDVTVLSR